MSKRVARFTARCPFLMDDDGNQCGRSIEVVAYPYRPGSYLDPPEGGEIEASGCGHVEDASEEVYEALSRLVEDYSDLCEAARDAYWERLADEQRIGG